MPWKFNDLFESSQTININTSDTAPASPIVYDGGNYIWFLSGNSVKQLRFYDPTNYGAVDMNTKPAQDATKFGVNQTIALTFTPRLLSTFPGSAYVYVADYPVTTITRIAIANGATTTLTGFGGCESNICASISGGVERVYLVNKCPTTQGAADSQYLIWTDMSAITTGPVMPGRKQTTCRDLVAVNDRIYVTSYNSNTVNTFNAQTGAHIATIAVNRQPSKLMVSGTNVYVTSAAAPVTIGEKTASVSMVSKITSSNVVSHDHGIFGLPEAFVDDGAYIWACNASGYLQRINKSTNQTFYTKGVEPALTPEDPDPEDMNDDFLIDQSEASGIKSIFMTPVVGSVPKHLFMVKTNKITCIQLPDALKWEYSMSMNQNTAVATGGDSYKGEV